MNDILELIKKSNSILLLTHEHPDGDAIGSIMAVYHFLIDINKSVDIVVPEIPPVFNFMTSINKIVDKSDKEYDLAIVLDCSKEERIGQNNGEFLRCSEIINIDHHVINSGYGTINHVEADVSSCCQVLYYLFKKWNVSFTKEISEALIVGLLTDTSGFANDNLYKNSFEMVAELFDNVNFHEIYYNVLSKKSMAQFSLMKLVTSRLEFFENGKIAFSYITKKDLIDAGAKLGDHEGLVDIGRNIEGVEVSIFIREDDGYRVSFRSNGMINVNNIASRLGGGGHTLAAGTTIDRNFEETKDIVIIETKKEFNP